MHQCIDCDNDVKEKDSLCKKCSEIHMRIKKNTDEYYSYIAGSETIYLDGHFGHKELRRIANAMVGSIKRRDAISEYEDI